MLDHVRVAKALKGEPQPGQCGGEAEEQEIVWWVGWSAGATGNGPSAPVADRALHQADAFLLTKAVAMGSTLGSTTRAQHLPGEVSLLGGLYVSLRARQWKCHRVPRIMREGFISHPYFSSPCGLTVPPLSVPGGHPELTSCSSWTSTV